MNIAAIVLVLGGLGWIVYNIVAWRTAEFAVTNMRVLREEGLAKKRSSTTLLSSLSDVKSSVSFVGGKLGYGDISLLTQSGSAGEDRFLCITNPIDFRNAVMNQKMADRRDPHRAFPGPGRCRCSGGRAGRCGPGSARDDLVRGRHHHRPASPTCATRAPSRPRSSRSRRRSCSPGCD